MIFENCDFCKPTDMFCDMCEKNQDFIPFLISEMPEFSLTKEQLEEFMKHAKDYPIEVEAREMKNGKYHVSLWEILEDEEEETGKYTICMYNPMGQKDILHSTNDKEEAEKFFQTFLKSIETLINQGHTDLKQMKPQLEEN